MSKLTPKQITAYKSQGKKIVMLTAYDYPSARILDQAGIDVLLVGDSLANVVQGKQTTLPVTLEEIIYHSEMVARATELALVVVDIPFPHCQLGPKNAIRIAARILKETQADAVKLEGGEKRAETVEALTEAGIPVMGHCGLLPQEVRQNGGYFIQRQREQLLRDVTAIEQAGAFGIVLECVDAAIAEEMTQSCSVPTIGIGSGAGCNGQVLVFHDLLGFVGPDEDKVHKHVRRYANLRDVIEDAVKSYANDVRTAIFPDDQHSF